MGVLSWALLAGCFGSQGALPPEGDGTGDGGLDAGSSKRGQPPVTSDVGGLDASIIDAGGVAARDAASSVGGDASLPDANGTDGALPVPGDGGLSIAYSPMYSAYDGVHVFRLPVAVHTPAGTGALQWSAEPAAAVAIEPGAAPNSVMLQTLQPGRVVITVRTASSSASAELLVTDADASDWEVGQARYNNGVGFPPVTDAAAVELPRTLACPNCHGDGAAALDVQHSPQQTALYSDDQLLYVITAGVKPNGAVFHSPFPASVFAGFHRWSGSDAELRGLVVYLRSLAPRSQGPFDFQGLMESTGSASTSPALGGSSDTDAGAGAPLGAPGSVTPWSSTLDSEGRLPCGVDTCDATGCCFDIFDSSCGVPLGANGCVPQPPQLDGDPRCPSLSLPPSASLLAARPRVNAGSRRASSAPIASSSARLPTPWR